MIKLSNTIIILYVFLSTALFAQNKLSEVLNCVEKNNTQIQAASLRADARYYKSKADNALEGVELGYGYFPSAKEAGNAKKTIEISKSFYFPTTYYKKNKFLKSEKNQSLLNKNAIRQQILLDAKLLAYEIVFLNKQKALLEKRTAETEKLCSLYVQKQKAENATLMEVNKTYLHLLMYKNLLNNNASELSNKTAELYLMCGKKEDNYTTLDYAESSPPALDTLLQQSIELSAAMQYQTGNAALAEAALALSKSKRMPHITAGLESEATNTEAFRGVRIGLQLPLSSNKHETNAAKAEAQAISLETHRAKENFRTSIEMQYNNMLLLKNNYENLKNSDALITNSKLLDKSLNFGQITLIEYYRELDYINEIQDQMLLLEKEYMQALARMNIYKF